MVHSYDQYRLKRRLDLISKAALLISVIVDVGMLILSGFAIEMCVTANPLGDCAKPFTEGFVNSIAIVCIIRCFHIFPILLLFCVAPCFMFGDQCCLKRRLVRQQAAPRHTIDQLRDNWSW